MQPGIWMILPFGLLLGLMALGPLFCPAWWGRHYSKVIVGLPLAEHLALTVLLLTASICSAQSNDWRLEAQLIRVSDREPGIIPNAKVVEPVIASRLGKMPFRWDNFYEVARKPVSLPRSGVKSIPLNRLYHLQIRDLGKSQLEVGFYRKEKLLNKVRHPFSTGEMLILGGDNQDKETWLVILRGIDPRKI